MNRAEEVREKANSEINMIIKLLREEMKVFFKAGRKLIESEKIRKEPEEHEQINLRLREIVKHWTKKMDEIDESVQNAIQTLKKVLKPSVKMKVACGKKNCRTI